MTVLIATPPSELPDVYGGDPVVFDARMQALLQWLVTAAGQMNSQHVLNAELSGGIAAIRDELIAAGLPAAAANAAAAAAAAGNAQAALNEIQMHWQDKLDAAAAHAEAAGLSQGGAAASAESAQSDAHAAALARDAALVGAGVYATEAAGRAAVADGAAFKVQGSGKIATYEYRRVDAASSTLIATYPSKAAYDALDALIFDIPDTFDLRIVEMDSQGRMSRYVDSAGKTYLVLRSDVVLPGEQVTSLPYSALASDVASKLFPPGFAFLTSGVDPFCFTDSSGRKSELTIDASGRFPEWVARAIVARGSSTAQPFDNTILPRVYTDCTGLQDGATVPIDTGQSSSSFGNAPISISGGAAVHGQVVGSNNAGYLEVALTGKVTRIGAAVKFPVGADNATVDLVLPVSSWAATYGGASAAGVHFVLLGSGSWECSYWHSGESNYMKGRIENLCDGIARYIDLQVQGNTVTIKLPDGSVATATDSRVSGAISNLAIWELYELGVEANRASILAIWADCAGLATPLRDTRPMAIAINNFICKG